MFFLSWRQLMARKKQTLLILLGISFGTMLFVSISGIQLGMRGYMTEMLLNNTAHILISGSERMIDPAEVTEALYGSENAVGWVLPPYGKREESRLENYQGWYDRLSQDAEVLDFSPRLSTNAIFSHGTFTVSAQLIGVLPQRHLRTTTIEKYMKEGSFARLSSGAATIVIGSEMAKNLGARLEQYINVSGGKGNPRPYKIVGVVHFGNKQIDNSLAFAELHHVQTLARRSGRVSEIAVSLFDMDNSAEKAAEWKMISGDKVEDWQEANKGFKEIIRVQDYTRYFITSSILLVAAFGIYNVLTIMINQKKREIAILRAIGYGPRKILHLILYQGVLLGIVGGLLGLFLGFLVCRLIGSVDLGIELGGSHFLLISYDWEIYAAAFLAANIASLVASYFPALAASQMTPMEIIRSEP
jgi:lipoprotein-releasing system permease protein